MPLRGQIPVRQSIDSSECGKAFSESMSATGNAVILARRVDEEEQRAWRG
jgi:hypothetical protein